MKNDKETEGDGYYRESVISRYMETVEEIQGCGVELGTVRTAGAQQV